jgi:hypothetical protein
MGASPSSTTLNPDISEPLYALSLALYFVSNYYWHRGEAAAMCPKHRGLLERAVKAMRPSGRGLVIGEANSSEGLKVLAKTARPGDSKGQLGASLSLTTSPSFIFFGVGPGD